MELARLWAAGLLALALMALPAASMEGKAAQEPHPDLVDFINISPQPASEDIMNDEIPHVLVMGDRLVIMWETDYTHWPNPDGTQPIEYPENEDVQVRFWENGTLSPVFNLSTDGVRPEGYGHRPAMALYQDQLYVWWNSHAWSENGSFEVVLRVYDPVAGTWDAPRGITETPDGGISAGASAAVHQGRLWFAWQGRGPMDPDAPEPGPGLEVYARWTDGETWGPVSIISGGRPGPDTEPDLVSSGGHLHVAWDHDHPETPGSSEIRYRRLLPSGGWSEMQEGLGNGPERDDKKIRLEDWNGTPVMVWQSDGINQKGRVFSDAMLSVHQGDGWGPARVVNPNSGDSSSVMPSATAVGDLLFISWSTSDDAVTLGTDLDVVMRDFDGERFGDVVVLSPTDTQLQEKPSDEGSSKLVLFQGNLWVVFDAIFSPITDGDDKDVILRYVGYDRDGDGSEDMVDAFPLDPEEQVDSDGDGVGDNRDAYPYDAYRWRKEGTEGTEGIPGDWCIVGAMLASVAVPIVLLLWMHRTQGGGGEGKRLK